MWVYVPGPPPAASTSSVCAPEAEVSTSDSNWQSQVLALSCWWRGKPSPSPIWSRRCAKVSWLKRLSGAMCEPSRAAHGVASLMASLAESRVNLTPSPASGSVPKTNATSGATRAESSLRRGRGSSSSRTSPACSQAAAPNASSETFADLVIRLRSDYSARQKSARATNGNASSSSQWPTMRTGDGALSPLPESTSGRISRIEEAVSLWSTPRSSDGEKGGPNQRFSAGGIPLAAQTAQWPTPDAAVSNEGEDPETFLARQERIKATGINGNGMGTPLAMAAKMWPTPAARDVKGANGPEHMENGTGRLHLDQLPNFVQFLWRTPTASEGKRGNSPAWIPDDKAGEHSLNRQASQWMTPRTVVGKYTRDSGDPEKERLTLEGQATLASFLPDRPISTVGEESSHIRRTLNPRFVEWLMGWPLGWTSLGLTPPASNGFACSETALYHWKQAMRSALYALGLPQAAPPAQLNLFG
jgi:hypothetical protein